MSLHTLLYLFRCSKCLVKDAFNNDEDNDDDNDNNNDNINKDNGEDKEQCKDNDNDNCINLADTSRLSDVRGIIHLVAIWIIHEAMKLNITSFKENTLQTLLTNWHRAEIVTPLWLSCHVMI